MGLFSLLKILDNTELAYQLFNFDTNGIYAREVRQILRNYTKRGEKEPDRQDVFLKAIDLIGEPQTPKEKYIVAEAYLWSRYPFKLKGIEYGNKYLSGELWEKACESWVVPKNATNNLETKRNIERYHFLQEIGKIYESEYLLEEALKNYKEGIKLVPFWSDGYTNSANVLVKLGRKEEALELLKRGRLSQYYKPYSTKVHEWETNQINNDFQNSIETGIKDIEKKIEKKYQYRPRPSKCVWEQSYYDRLSTLQKKYLQEFIEKELVTIK